MKPRRSHVGARRARAYTAVEVLLAMTVMLISTAGVMSMQKASIQGNLDARKLDVANSIARIWLDRLATDTEGWSGANGLVATNWLGPAVTLAGAYATPATIATPTTLQSGAFDMLGRDVDPADPTVPTAFCAHIKVDPVALNPAGVPVLLRATVLVYWPKQLGATPQAAPLCSEGDVAHTEAGSPGTYHMIYASEALRSPAG